MLLKLSICRRASEGEGGEFGGGEEASLGLWIDVETSVSRCTERILTLGGSVRHPPLTLSPISSFHYVEYSIKMEANLCVETGSLKKSDETR